MGRHTELVYMHLRARAGAMINDCKLDAVALALEHECNVQLLHNTKTYWIEYKDILKLVKEGV